MSGQLKTRERARSIRKVHPTDREVLLARLLLRVADELWENGPGDAETDQLYNDVKSLSEGVVRWHDG